MVRLKTRHQALPPTSEQFLLFVVVLLKVLVGNNSLYLQVLLVLSFREFYEYFFLYPYPLFAKEKQYFVKQFYEEARQNKPRQFLQNNGDKANYQKIFADNGYIIAVDNVSLEVHEGEILIIMGLSGSGKSTLLRCLSRLIESTDGKVDFEGKNLLTMSSEYLIQLRRHKMGMVFQNFALLPHKTVLQNIVFPLQIRDKDIKKNIRRTREMIKLVGLEGRENYFPRELSGGQQQRVGIARSLAVEPDVWFLDEPFSALDPLIRHEMQDEFLRLQSLLKKTIVFITHDFNEALRLADRVAIMYNGKIEQVGTPAEIVLNPATNYVKKFTNEIPREKVLTVTAVMDKLNKNEKLTQKSITENELIENVAEQVLGGDQPVPVKNSQGKIVGVLHQKKVLNVLFGKRK